MMNLDLQKVLPAEAFERQSRMRATIGKDGLLYCVSLQNKKQTRLPASVLLRQGDIVPCICKCKVEGEQTQGRGRKEETGNARLERLKASDLKDAPTESGKAGRIPGGRRQSENLQPRRQLREKDLMKCTRNAKGCCFWGTVGTRKKKLHGRLALRMSCWIR